MESDANAAFEHNFSARVSSQSRLNTRENPLFSSKSQAKPSGFPMTHLLCKRTLLKRAASREFFRVRPSRLEPQERV